MKKHLNLLVVWLCIVIGSLGVSAVAAETIPVSPGTVIAGNQLEEYANIWWQWAYSMSPEESAVHDRVGTKCHTNQSGDVWFLAGGYGNALIRRVCSMPADKYLFFPVINMVYSPPVSRPVSCERVKQSAALNNNAMLSIYVEVDGQVLSNPEKFRMKSLDCFNLAGRVPASMGAEPVYPSAADGFWVMLEPLSPGRHIIRFHAQYNRPEGAFGSMAQNIEYVLLVGQN